MNFFKTCISTALALVLSIGMTTAQTFTIDTDASSIIWTGSKIIGGGHSGTVSVASGKLVLIDGELEKGSFAADMTTVAITDLPDAMANKLSRHLFSDDFFGVSDHPSSTFEIKSIEKKGEKNYSVIGNLTIKGQTNSITFPANLSWENELPVATAKVKVDRTRFGIHYGSDSFFDNLGDKAISDEFELDIKLVGKR